MTASQLFATRRRARMYGVGEGPKDVHFGNNIVLPAGVYAVEAAINGERAHFSVTIAPGA